MIKNDIEKAKQLGHFMIGPIVNENNPLGPVTIYSAKCQRCNSKIEYITDAKSFSNTRKDSSALNVLCKREE